MGQTTISAHGAEELFAALRKAGPGTTIDLAPGNYGRLDVNVAYGSPWGSFAGEVTIRSADANNPATFTGMHLRGVKNLTLDGVAFDYTAPKGAARGAVDFAYPVIVQESANITLRNSTLEGDVLDRPGDLFDKLPVAIGLFVRESKEVAVENNEFLNWHRGAISQNTTGLVFKGNDLHTLRSDGLDFVAVQDVLIEGNTFHDFVSRAGVGDHRDMIQFWSAGARSATADVTIRGNIMNSGEGFDTQSIFMRNDLVDTGAAGRGMYYRNVVVENNVIYNAHLNGIFLGETDGLKIRNNTLLHNPDSGDSGTVSRPIIRVSPAAQNVEIANNIAGDVPAGRPGWTVANNLIVQNGNPDQGNYYDDLFLNVMTGGGEADLAALQAMPGGAVERAGQGAFMTHFDRTPDALTAVIRPEAVTDNTISFDAGYTANAKGLVGPGAKFRWELGDGAVREGVDIDHTYAKPGLYKIKLTVTDAGGKTDTALAEAYVPEPLRLGLDVTARGLVDISSYGATALPGVQVAQDGGRYAFRLMDKTGFEIGRNVAPIYDMDAFEISFGLKAVSGGASAGDIFRIHDNMLLKVGSGGSFGVEFINDAGKSFEFWSDATKAMDGKWHKVSLTYDRWEGELVVAVDGVEAGTIAASGSSRPMEWWGLHFGSKWGTTGFDGLIDDFKIVSGSGSLPPPSAGGPVVVEPSTPVDLPEAPPPAPPSAPTPAPPPVQAPAPAPTPGLSFDLAIAHGDGRLIDEDVTDGEVLALDALNGPVTLIATPSADVESVKMDLVGVFAGIENVTPYVLFGDNEGSYNAGRSLDAGDYELVLTAYSGDNGGGSVLGSDTIEFSVADGPGDVVARWNAGANTVAATDGGPAWKADASAIVGSAKLFSSPIAESGSLDDSVPGTTPRELFAQEYYGDSKAEGMGLEFGDGALPDGRYAVRLYMGNGYSGTDDPGERLFDVRVEGQQLLDDIDLAATLGHKVGGMFEWQGTVDDGTIDIDFGHGIENPLINGVEILRLDDVA